MLYIFHIHSIIYFIISILAVVLAGVVWTRRLAPGAAFLSIFMLCAAYWTIINGIYSGAMEYSDKVFWSKMEYLGILSSSIFWIIFVLDFTGSNWFRRKLHLLYLLIIPSVTMILVLTNELHNLIWTDISWITGPFGPTLIFKHGFWFWIHASYCYLLYLTGVVILIITSFRKDHYNRLHVIGLLSGTLIPFAGNVLYVFELMPGKGLDLNPFYFILSGIIFSLTIVQFKFLDIIPLARNRFVEELPDGVLIINKDGNIININPVAERMLGIQKEQAQDKKLAIYCPKLDVIRSQIGMEGHTETNLDSPRSFFDINILPFKDNREICGQLIVLRNINEQKSAERVLRESELKYETLVEQSNNGVLIIQDGICKYVNRTLSEISNYSIIELLNSPLSSYILDEDMHLIEEWSEKQSKSEASPNYYEMKLKRKDGEIRDIEISAGNINYDGRHANMITIHDVTERLADQKKLEYLYKEEVKLRSSFQEEINKRSKYFQALVHELRTPLTSILASGELLESINKVNNQAVLIHRVRQASLLLEKRVSELIELARGETGAIKIYPVPLDLTTLINEIVSEKLRVAVKKGINISVDIVQSIPPVLGDKVRLNYIINNLLDNAISFTSEGEIIVKVTMHSPRYAVVQIKDSGMGITQDEMASLFDPYHKNLSLTQYPDGLSIGLALSKIFVDLHKGNIWVESIPGKGSVFSFTIPVSANENEPYKII